MINNEIGKVYGKLTVIDFADNIGTRKAWLCKCECGNEIVVKGTDLRTGRKTHCGCSPKRGGFVDETGNRYGRLIVIKENGKSKNRQIMWECKCDCGNIVIVRGTDLRQGKTRSCGCLMNEARGQSTLKDLTGLRFGKLLVLEPITIYKQDKRRTYWRCQCDCGNITIVNGANLRYGGTQSCGCVQSKGNMIINNILRDNNINFKNEVTFSDLKTSKDGFPRFDFGIYQNQKLIALCEYNGIQHYEDRGEFGKMQREYTDLLKTQYCKDNNIPLYIIKYNEDVSLKVIEMLNELDLLNIEETKGGNY